MSVIDAVLSLCPGAEVVVRGNDPEAIEWVSEPERKPSVKEIKAEVERLARDHEAHEYRRKRAAEYPPIGDQLDDLMKQGAFSKEMTDRLLDVKTRFPKSAP
jgi:hypothetical protein